MQGRNQSRAQKTNRTENSPEIAAGAPPCRREAALGRAGGACVRPSECEGAVRAGGRDSRLKYFVGWAES
jgi:hypothetical protein